jgi:hypothetical protein
MLSSLLSVLSATLGHIQPLGSKFSFGIKFSMLVSIHVEKIQALRKIGLSTESGRCVHQKHLVRLAMEGVQTTVYQLRDFEAEPRHATLVAILIDTETRKLG